MCVCDPSEHLPSLLLLLLEKKEASVTEIGVCVCVIHLLSYAVSSSEDIAVVNKAATAIQFTTVGKGDHPRVLVHCGRLPANYSSAAVRSPAFCPQKKHMNN